MWKLEGIVDAQTEGLSELDPKDCTECYILAFDKDDTFSGRITTNILFGSYEINYIANTFRFSNIGGTEAIDIGGGELYRQILLKIQTFIVKSSYPRILHLYYNSGKNYLKYQEIGG